MKRITIHFIQILEIILLLFLVAIAFVSFSSRIPFLANRGISFFAVTSGSMEPIIKTGSLIYSSRFKADELKEGDIITFKLISDIEKKEAIIVTHRINKIKKTTTLVETGRKTKKPSIQYEFVTKGDANNIVDLKTVTLGNILGKYQFSIPYVGYLISYTHTFNGFMFFIIAPALILIIWEIISLIIFIKKHYEKKAEEKINKILASKQKKKYKKNA